MVAVHIVAEAYLGHNLGSEVADVGDFVAGVGFEVAGFGNKGFEVVCLGHCIDFEVAELPCSLHLDHKIGSVGSIGCFLHLGFVGSLLEYQAFLAFSSLLHFVAVVDTVRVVVD